MRNENKVGTKTGAPDFDFDEIELHVEVFRQISFVYLEIRKFLAQAKYHFEKEQDKLCKIKFGSILRQLTVT